MESQYCMLESALSITEEPDRRIVSNFMRRKEALDYARLPSHFFALLRYMGVSHDNRLLERRICAHSLWLKAADNAIDKGDACAETIIAVLEGRKDTRELPRIPAYLLSGILAREMPENATQPFLASIKALCSVASRKQFATLDDYIESRSYEGVITARTFCILARNAIDSDPELFFRAYEQTGKTGNLVDSANDFLSDLREGLIIDARGRFDQGRLWSAAAKEFYTLVREHPGMIRLFGGNARRQVLKFAGIYT